MLRSFYLTTVYLPINLPSTILLTINIGHIQAPAPPPYITSHITPLDTWGGAPYPELPFSLSLLDIHQ